MVEKKQLRTERGEKSSQYKDVLSAPRRLALDNTSVKGRLEALLSKLQLLYEENRKVLVKAGPSSQVVEDDSRVRGLRSQVVMMEIERVASVSVASLSKRESDALKVWNAELDSEVTRLRSEIDTVKHLREEVNRLGHDV